jgi:hypothetical protein
MIIDGTFKISVFFEEERAFFILYHNEEISLKFDVHHTRTVVISGHSNTYNYYPDFPVGFCGYEKQLHGKESQPHILKPPGTS